MGRDRRDRTMEEWINDGDELLKKMGEKHKLYKKVSALLSDLNSNKDDAEKHEIIDALNLEKDKLGEAWLKWTKSIKQKAKDKKRHKFYISEKTYDDILSFIGLKNEDSKFKKHDKGGKKNETSDNKIFKILFDHISSFGVSDVKEMYTLIDELNKFGSASSERYSKDALTSESKGYKGETGKVIHAIIEELKRNKITNFEKLKKIRSTVNRELSEDNKQLLDENEKLKRRIRELEL
ncbi:hypothetical protein [Shewanella sp. M16]|uniref:hypothetical protein n=1 Tax=Shewanella sp. M16 TaxID=2830837 RepID=UPI001BAFAFA9|nr:hypothetical protein [Shewanella sp. M16]